MSTKNNTISVSHEGNTKLGPKISVFSRAVGDTCPTSCELLGNGCYAQRTERIYTTARRAGLRNVRIQDWQKLRSFILDAAAKNNAIRWHERGDFLKLDSLGRKIVDRPYISNIIRAVESIKQDGIDVPKMLCYTHVYSPYIIPLQNYMTLYASVDSAADFRAAKRVGFKLFAWSTGVKKSQGTKMWENHVGDQKIVCWEQLGTKATCSDCMYCWKGLGDIAWVKH